MKLDAGFQIIILIAFVGLMYFLLIRPQKKKEKEVKQMRNTLSVGDEVITIGGICGKIVKTKDQTLILQVGADRVKFEVMRWSISSVTKKGKTSGKNETEERKTPKRLKKSKPAEAEKENETVSEAKEDTKAKTIETEKEITETEEQCRNNIKLQYPIAEQDIADEGSTGQQNAIRFFGFDVKC